MEFIKKLREIRCFPILGAIAVFVLLTFRVVYFYFNKDTSLIGIIPDDAFYYIQLARHRVEDGIWSFDGHSIATGFHILYAYLLVAIFVIFGNIEWKVLYLCIGILSSVTIGFAAYLALRTVASVYGIRYLPAALAPFVVPISLMQSSLMMESWLVLLFSSLTIFAISKENNPDFRGVLGLVGIGILGSLSRSDYGLFPGMLFMVAMLESKFSKNEITIRTGSVLLGAILGLAIVLVHNFEISGHFLQASAEIKYFWSSIQGHWIWIPTGMISLIAFPSYKGVGLALMTTILCVFLVRFLVSIKGLLKKNDKHVDVKSIIYFACMLTLLGYILVYRLNSVALGVWYASNMMIPVAIVMAATSFYILKRRWILISVLIVTINFSIGVHKFLEIPWKHAASMMQAGTYLKENLGNAKIASWNAGIISYFSEKPIINIDGLTNDEVLSYVKSNTLLDYLKKNNIEYIVDFEYMFSAKFHRMRGGYDDERVQKCFVPTLHLGGDFDHWVDSKLMLFEVKANCL